MTNEQPSPPSIPEESETIGTPMPDENATEETLVEEMTLEKPSEETTEEMTTEKTPKTTSEEPLQEEELQETEEQTEPSENQEEETTEEIATENTLVKEEEISEKPIQEQEPQEIEEKPEPAKTEEEKTPSESEENPEVVHVDFDLLDIDGRWLLKVISGPNSGAEFSVHGGSSYLIGTDTESCDIVFQDLSVSRKHARLTVDAKNAAILEDLKSRNGTFVDGERVEKKSLSGNALISMGTTTFMLIDRESERTTIVAGASPEGKESKPSVESAPKPPEQNLGQIQQAVLAPLQSEIDRVKEDEKLQAKLSHAVSSLVILAVVTGLIMTIGIGGALLFRTEEVTSPVSVNPDAEISRALAGFPAIRYSYNPVNNRLLLVGHVLTTTDRSRMLDVLQQLRFIHDIDYNNVVIDEIVWREINEVLSKNPAWRGISITSPVAGRYVISGFLQTRAQAEELFDYISQNFAYVDLLERRVVVEEELLGQVSRELNESGFRGVTPSLKGGDLTLTGSVGIGTKERFQKLVTVFKALPGIRSVQVLVSEAGQKEAVIDLTSKYTVTGYSKTKSKVSVVVNGRILEPGDSLDGMLITDISQSTVYLEKGNIRYKIDFNR